MSVVVDAARLRREMARRGWAAVDLAREARLSQATISAALAGRPVTVSSVALMARALARVPPIDAIDFLFLDGSI
jgi:transcriptional regulator with XRE-family HTH domain